MRDVNIKSYNQHEPSLQDFNSIMLSFFDSNLASIICHSNMLSSV